VNLEARISPAFEPFLADSGPKDKRDAIVIYRTSEPPEGPRLRGRMRTLKERLVAIKQYAAAQEPIEARGLEGYREHSRRRLGGKQELHASGVARALPVASVEVTRATLPVLARQPGVAAVLPNQRIHLAEPKRVDYEALAKQEAKDGLTWGLKQLNIPKLWESTRGEGINVAVLDTGVHGEHPALKDRVKGFILVDPLGRRIQVDPTFDGHQHGTHVSGTIAGGNTEDGVAIGVAPEAKRCSRF
jgi:serine protease AprX